jgi:hypothetical protein
MLLIRIACALFPCVLFRADRLLYLNDDEEVYGSAAGRVPAEFRLDTSAPIKLARTVKVYSERQDNRFADDFVPAIPAGGPAGGVDALVASSLAALNRPIKAFLRTHVKYHRVVNPNAPPTLGAGGATGRRGFGGAAAAASTDSADAEGKDKGLVDFEVDEPFRHSGELPSANGNPSSAAGGATTAGASGAPGNVAAQAAAAKKKPAGGLADIFNQPGETAAAPPAAAAGAAGGASLAATTTNSAAALAAQAAEEAAREEEIESLVQPDLLRVSAAKAEAAVEADRSTFARTEESVFLRSAPAFDWREHMHKAEYTICKRMPPSAATGMWSRDVGSQFLISVASLRLGIGNIEPFFGCLALYDLRQGVRLSEDFHFDLNDNSLLTGQLEVNKSCADAVTLSPHALFSVQDKHADVVLVVKLERILQGDPAELSEQYFKLKARTPAEMAALVKKTRNNLIYLGDYRQPFGWAMMTLFEDNGELRPFGSPMALPHERGQHFARMERIYSQTDALKDDLFVALMRETRDSNGSKGAGKQYPGTHLDLRIEEMTEGELPVNRVDVSLIPLKNTEQIKAVPAVAEYNVAADAPLPTGPGGSGPSIVVPGTPSAAAPPTPMAASTPHHQSQHSISVSGLGPLSQSSSFSSASPSSGPTPSSSSGAAGNLGPVAPAHCTPYSNNPVSSPPMVREVEEFSDYAPPLSGLPNLPPPVPHTFFVNLLYLYPEFVKFEKFRNIACKVQFRSSDASVVAEGLPVLRGKSSGANLTLSQLTQVNYHKKQCTPQDEIKCMLPLQLTPATHLFFTFYKVSCKTKVSFLVAPWLSQHDELAGVYPVAPPHGSGCCAHLCLCCSAFSLLLFVRPLVFSLVRARWWAWPVSPCSKRVVWWWTMCTTFRSQPSCPRITWPLSPRAKRQMSCITDMQAQSASRYASGSCRASSARMNMCTPFCTASP